MGKPPLPRRPFAAAFLGLVLALLSACAGLPPNPPDRPTSQALPLDRATTLGRVAQASQPDPGLSGFRLLPLGLFSLDARVQLARRAEASLDVQYYQFANDETGRWLLRALRDAADRGVRVRLLLDDLYTGGNDELWLAFAAHPNVEVRLFNPFCCARDETVRGRYLASWHDFDRVNHRMHNKLFIADGAMAVIGGRNVANEYYLRGATGNYVDVDAFVVGFIVPPLQFHFDRYWNSASAYPIDAVTRTRTPKDVLRQQFEAWTGPATTPPPEALPRNDILGYGPISDDLDFGRLGLIWADAFVFADHPDKPFDGRVGGSPLDTSVTFNLFEVVRSAKREVVASSPYFVPGELSLAMFRELRSRGVEVAVMTNSLASTDEPLVHVGYSRHREELLRMGVELYELSGSRLKENKRMFLFGESLGRLHAKLVVVDKSALFIGSMNLDPRSASLNTELGVVVRSQALAKELLRVIDIDRYQSAYRVRLRGNGEGLEWIGVDGEKERILTEEPDSTAWLRFKSRLLAPFVPQEQL